MRGSKSRDKRPQPNQNSYSRHSPAPLYHHLPSATRNPIFSPLLRTQLDHSVIPIRSSVHDRQLLSQDHSRRRRPPYKSTIPTLHPPRRLHVRRRRPQAPLRNIISNANPQRDAANRKQLAGPIRPGAHSLVPNLLARFIVSSAITLHCHTI